MALMRPLVSPWRLTFSKQPVSLAWATWNPPLRDFGGWPLDGLWRIAPAHDTGTHCVLLHTRLLASGALNTPCLSTHLPASKGNPCFNMRHAVFDLVLTRAQCAP